LTQTHKLVDQLWFIRIGFLFCIQSVILRYKFRKYLQKPIIHMPEDHPQCCNHNFNFDECNILLDICYW